MNSKPVARRSTFERRVRLIAGRTLIVLAVPVFLPLEVLWTFGKEIKSAFAFAWLTARQEWASVRYYWKEIGDL